MRTRTRGSRGACEPGAAVDVREADSQILEPRRCAVVDRALHGKQHGGLFGAAAIIVEARADLANVDDLRDEDLRGAVSYHRRLGRALDDRDAGQSPQRVTYERRNISPEGHEGCIRFT